MRSCVGCGAEIPPQRGSARPRKYCTSCRPPRNRPNPRVIALPESVGEPEMVTAYRRELVEAQRLETADGRHVMHLVTLFAAGNHTAAGAASMSRELAAAKDRALRGAASKADALDELSARRRRKASSA